MLVFERRRKENMRKIKLLLMLNTPVDMVAYSLKAFDCAFPGRERMSYIYDSTAVPQRGKRVCRIGRLPYISTYGKM
jgi:hypothetical protein